MLPFDNGSPAPQKPEGGNKPPYPNKHYDFFVDGTKYRTEHMLLTGAQIKQIAHVPAEFALILVHPGHQEELIADDKPINLSRPGVEKFVTRKKAEEIVILVNTSPKPYTRPVISYDEVVALAGFTPGPNSHYTVSYTNGPAANPSGDLLPGDTVQVQNMMSFSVSGTVVS